MGIETVRLLRGSQTKGPASRSVAPGPSCSRRTFVIDLGAVTCAHCARISYGAGHSGSVAVRVSLFEGHSGDISALLLCRGCHHSRSSRRPCGGRRILICERLPGQGAESRGFDNLCDLVRYRVAAVDDPILKLSKLRRAKLPAFTMRRHSARMWRGKSELPSLKR